MTIRQTGFVTDNQMPGAIYHMNTIRAAKERTFMNTLPESTQSEARGVTDEEISETLGTLMTHLLHRESCPHK